MAQHIDPGAVAAAYQYCLRIARQHYENFPTASWLIRKDLRPAVAAIYAFARQADDIADEGDRPAEVRLKELDAQETLLERCIGTPVDHPVFLALGDSIRRLDLPIELFHDLLTAFRMDVSIHGYATVEELHFYCRHSANPIGRLMLALHGITDTGVLHASDAICTALQLANFWQDLSIDLPRGRCYLPAAWLEEHAINVESLLRGEVKSEALQPVLHQAVQHTESLFQQGEALLQHLPFRLRLQAAATLFGGRKILCRVGKLSQPLTQRATLSTSDWLSLALPICMGAVFPPQHEKVSV